MAKNSVELVEQWPKAYRTECNVEFRILLYFGFYDNSHYEFLLAIHLFIFLN